MINLFFSFLQINCFHFYHWEGKELRAFLGNGKKVKLPCFASDGYYIIIIHFFPIFSERWKIKSKMREAWSRTVVCQIGNK